MIRLGTKVRTPLFTNPIPGKVVKIHKEKGKSFAYDVEHSIEDLSREDIELIFNEFGKLLKGPYLSCNVRADRLERL